MISSPGHPHASPGTISGSSGKLPPAPAPPPPAVPPPLPPPLPAAGKPEPPLGYQPNIVMILTDDQDVEIGGLEPMPKLRKLLGDAGATFKHFCGPPPGPLGRADGSCCSSDPRRRRAQM